MLITFKSKAAADILMYQEHAQPILDLLNKDAKQGIITAEQAAQAVQVLEQAIAEARQQEQSHQEDDDQDTDDVRPRTRPVGFATRAYPLLEMLRSARDKGKDVVWGV